MATDTTRDWGQDFERIWGEGDNRYFRKFWRNVVRWLAENSAGGNRKLQVDVDKVIYRPGQPIQIIVRAFDEEARPADSYRVVARVRQGGDQGQTAGPEPGSATGVEASPSEVGSVELPLRLDDHSYRGDIPAPAASSVRSDSGSTLQQLSLEVIALDGEATAAQTTIELQLLDDPTEFVDPRPDSGRLAQLATSTGGQVLKTAEELATLVTHQTRAADRLIVSRRPLWDHPLVWALLLVLLAAEWIIRRRRGLA
jgi:hypothetical protein